MALAGGLLYGGWIARRIFVPVPPMADVNAPADTQQRPPVALVALILLLPVIFIFSATIAGMAGWLSLRWLGFLGHPFTALTIAALVAMATLGFGGGLNRDEVSRLATDSLAPIGSLLVIMGAGGAFKQVIVDSGVGPHAGKLLAASGISPLLVAYLVAAAMRVAQGSATVAIITAAGIVAPIVKSIAGYKPEIIVLALCTGGTILSHVNDAGFWIVKEYFGMTVPQTLKSWTVMKVVVSVVGFLIVLLIQAFFG
jgi:H+/gluconate symporter-like permease